MLPLIATSLATVAGIMLFGADISRLLFVFPTYQITSFRIVDFSLTIPSWAGVSSLTPQSVWMLYEDTFCKHKSRWQCLMWDWEGFLNIINNIECDMVKYVTTWGEEKPLIEADSYANFELSAEIHAGITVNNTQNSFGAHLHRAILDIYHPDLTGKLVNIGSIHDRNTETTNTDDSVYSSFSSERALPFPQTESSSENQSMLIITDRRGNTTNNHLEVEEIIHGFESPSFSILPRQIIHTVEDAIVIYLKSLSPKMLLNMAYQFIRNGKVLNITSSAVVYLKTLTSPMSITAGAICDNTLKFTLPSISSLLFNGEKVPLFTFDEVDCRIERLSTGWGNVTKMRGELRSILLYRNTKTSE